MLNAKRGTRNVGSEGRAQVSPTFQPPVPEGLRRIAWNGLSFCIPAEWELSGYDFPHKGITRIEVADIYCRRMQVEWGLMDMSPSRVRRLVKRYEDQSKSMTLKAETHETIDGLPPGWAATHYRFRESVPDASKRRLDIQAQDLMTAIYKDPETSLFIFFLIWFFPDAPELPASVIRDIAGTFQDHRGAERIPWVLFDISFEMPGTFQLEKATFDIGSKMMTFAWQQRRLMLWHLSCADVFLQPDVAPATWVAAHLNARSGLKAVRFAAGEGGSIRCLRRRLHPLGHRSEIAHWCFRYTAGWRLDEEQNRLVVWVYHYRREDDLAPLSMSEASG